MSMLVLRTGTFAAYRTVSSATTSRVVPFSSLRLKPCQFQATIYHAHRLSRNLTIKNNNTRRNNTAAFNTNKKSNHGYASRSTISTEHDLVQKIQKCRKAFDLGSLMRKANNGIFVSDRSSEAFTEKIKELSSKIRVKDASGLLNSLSKERVPSHKRKLQYSLMIFLVDIAMNKLNECKAKDISNIVNAMAKKGIKNEELFNTIAANAILIIETFNAQGLANTVNAYAKMNHHHPDLFDKIAVGSIPIIGTFNAQELANTANAYAKRNHYHPKLFNEIAIASISIISTFKAQGLANIANAYAKMDHHHPYLFDEIAAALIPIIGTFDAQGLANTVNAYAKMNHYQPDIFDKVAAVSIPIISTFNAQGLANTANAYAKMNYHHPDLFDKIATASIPNISTFNAQELANTVNAYAKMNLYHPDLFDKIATASIPIINTFNAQDLANTANAYAKMGHEHSDLLDKIATASIPMLNIFKAQGLANTANAFAKMNHQHPDLFDGIASASIPIINTFEAQGLANIANAYAKMNHHHPALFNEIATTSVAIISKFSSQDIANTASAFGKTRFSGKKVEQLFSFIAEIIVRDPPESNWSQQSLVEVAYAFLKLGFANEKLLDIIGTAIVSRNEIVLDAHLLGNLASCFDNIETSTSSQILKIVCNNFCSIKVDQIDLQSVADVSKAMYTAQRLNVVTPTTLQLVAALAILKVDECRMEDVRDIILGYSRVELSKDIFNELLIAYKPYVKKYFKDLSGPNQSKISKIYTESEIVI